MKKNLQMRKRTIEFTDELQTRKSVISQKKITKETGHTNNGFQTMPCDHNNKPKSREKKTKKQPSLSFISFKFKGWTKTDSFLLMHGILSVRGH